MPESETVYFALEIVRRLSDDSLNTMHRPLSIKDRVTLDAWPSGGLVQAAHAFTIEALRQEAYTMGVAMLAVGKKPEEITVSQLQERLLGRMIECCERFSQSVCTEALEKITAPPEPILKNY